MEAAILSHVLESHDRLIGVIDADDGLVRSNARARDLLLSPAEREQRATTAPRALVDAAEDARERGMVRRAVLVPTGHGDLFLHGHFWRLDHGHVGFALRQDTTPDSVELARLLGVQPWRAQKALRAAQELSDHQIAAALTSGGGDVVECIHRLVASPRRAALRAPLGRPRVAQQNQVEVGPPAALPRGSGDVPRAPADVLPRRARVLCVLGDSEEAYGESLSCMLEGLGHLPSRVSNARDALETLMLTDAYFDSVLVNLDMPAYAAVELASSVRRIRPGVRLSFYTSGAASVETAERARWLAPVLPRPARASDVRRALDHATSGDSAASRRPRFASSSRTTMRIRSILSALRRGR